MGSKFNIQALSVLFEKQFSERSGLVKDVKTAQFILKEYETATTRKYSCFKANKAFGHTGKWPFSRA